jgi:hypothetical protein
MNRRCAVLVAAVLGLASQVRAQLGEVQVGGLLSYGLGDAYGPGAGIVLGVAAGRITYIGVRWTYYTGSEIRVVSPLTQIDVTNRVQLFAFDLGVQVPVGAFEVVPGVSLGAARFGQRARPAGAGGPEAPSIGGTEFFVAPGVSIAGRVAGLVLIPEVQYSIAGDPEMPRPVTHRGLTASLRVVVPFEVGRVRR